MSDNIDLRGQLLMNLKVLYGPNIEVLTLFVNTAYGYRHQALAIGLDPLMATGTKFLHSELMGSSTNAIVNLFKISERELAELFLAGGTAVPFEGENNVVQPLTLRKDQDRPGSAGSGSLREDFELVNTPGSSLVDENGPREVVEDDLAGGSAPVEEIAEVVDECMSEKIEGVEDLPTIDEIPAPEPVPEEASVTQYSEYAPVAGRTKKDKKKGRKGKKVSDDPQLVPEEAPIDNFGSWGSSSQMTESKMVSNEPAIIEDPIIPAPEPEPVVEESWGWGSLVSKKGKKKKSKAALEDDCPVVEEPIIPVSEPEPLPVTDEPFDFGLHISKKDKKKKGKRTVDLEEPVITEQLLDEPKPESLLDDSGWGPLLLRKKKKNIHEVVVEEPVIEKEAVVPIPEPQPEPEDGGWGSLLKKPKKKKKNTRKEVVEEPVIEEEAVIPIPEPEPEPEDGGWGSLLKKPKKKKKNTREEVLEEPVIEEEAVVPIPEPQPEPEDDGWGSLLKKSKKKKDKAVFEEVKEPDSIPEPEPEPEVDPWSSQKPKKDKKKKGRVVVEDDHPAEEHATEEPTPDGYGVEECPIDECPVECVAEECVAEECAVEECPVECVADEAVIPDPESEVDPWSLERSKKDREKDPRAVWDELLVVKIFSENHHPNQFRLRSRITLKGKSLSRRAD